MYLLLNNEGPFKKSPRTMKVFSKEHHCIACELAQTHKLQSLNVGDVEAQEDNLPCNATPSERTQG